MKTGRCSRGTDSLTLCFLLRPDVGDVNISDDRTWAPTRVLTLTEVGDGDPGYIAVALLGAAGCCLLLAACFFCRIFQARFQVRSTPKRRRRVSSDPTPGQQSVLRIRWTGVVDVNSRCERDTVLPWGNDCDWFDDNQDPRDVLGR